jgi:hypothetical protein
MYSRDGLQRGELKGISSAVGGIFQVIEKGVVICDVSDEGLVRIFQLVESFCCRPAVCCKSTSISVVKYETATVYSAWDDAHSKSSKSLVSIPSESKENV